MSSSSLLKLENEAVFGNLEGMAVVREVQSDVNLYCFFIIFDISVWPQHIDRRFMAHSGLFASPSLQGWCNLCVGKAIHDLPRKNS